MKFATLPLAALVLALGACSGKKAADPDVAPSPPPPPQKTVFDTQLKALDRAKAVQGVVDQQNAEADKRLKDEGGG